MVSSQVVETAHDKIVEVHVTGTMTKEDYEDLVPQMEQKILQYGKIRVLLVMHDFHGWAASAMWEDVNFDFDDFNFVERLAIVGNAKWEQGMAAFCRPFTAARIKYFDHSNNDRARDWIEYARDDNFRFRRRS